MDYEKLHKETLNKLQYMVRNGKMTEDVAKGICSDFVLESDDERVRKMLITLVKKHLVNHERCMAESWLEKQKLKSNPIGPRWAPSKEQMGALDQACMDTHDGIQHQLLCSLYYDLEELGK